MDGVAESCCALARPAVQTQPRPNKRQRGGEEDEGEEGEGFVPADMTARILKQARSQQEELDAEEMPAGALAAATPRVARGGAGRAFVDCQATCC